MNDPAVLENSRTITNFEKSNQYREEVHSFIPGGAHTYSKGDDQFPELAPAAIARGRGGHVWDLDGNEYIDCGLALGAVSLGHAYGPVLDAVREQLELGTNFQRPASIELEYAKEFCSIVPGAERVKFAKNGSTLTSAAVKLSRAFTERPIVAFPGNHPFYSYDDWFIGRTLCDSGIPDPHKATSLTYNSTDPSTLAALLREHRGQVACVITEPTELASTPVDALHEVQRLCRENGTLLILDEMVTGFRAGWPGAVKELGLEPDLITWGKAIGNGFSFCALTGRADVMDLGGIKQTDRPRVFFSSTTHGGEAHGIAAALAVLREYQKHDVIGHHRALVAQVADGMRAAIGKLGLGGNIEVHALPWRVVVIFRDGEGAVSSPFRTLFLQEMIGRGVLFQGVFLPCFAHTFEDAARVVSMFEESATVYRDALSRGVEKHLVGEAARPVFRKFNGCTRQCPSQPCPEEHTCRERGQ